MQMNYPYQIREWVRTVTAQDDWLKGEPPIEEILTDPIMHLVMRRDNLGPADVWAAIDRGRAALHGRAPHSDAINSRNVA